MEVANVCKSFSLLGKRKYTSIINHENAYLVNKRSKLNLGKTLVECIEQLKNDINKLSTMFDLQVKEIQNSIENLKEQISQLEKKYYMNDNGCKYCQYIS